MDFRILGPLEVLDETGRSLPLGGAKQRALLAILLISANEVVSADRLIDDIWGEDPPPTAANALQVYVSQLRKVLRAEGRADGGNDRSEWIVTRSPGYELQVPPDDLDLGKFEDLTSKGREALMAEQPASASVLLRSALALWRGAALADFTYEPFAQIQIEKLEEMRLLAFEDRIEADLALGRHAEAIPEIEAAIAAEPLRERLREQLMLALYRSGRQADALAVFQDVTRLLGDQLGLDPGPAIRRLHEAILRQEPSLSLPEAKPPFEASFAGEPVAEDRQDQGEEASSIVERSDPVPSASRDDMLPVTVLFADIVGSTSLAERLSPEEVRAVVGECVSRMSRAVEAFDGMVQAYMGDGICAYFGLPFAHEDDVERASRAAIRIRRVAEGFAQEVESAWGISGFAVRIGINSGRTVVGMVGAKTQQEVAFGDAMNIAARLESIAAPGTIVVGEAVAARLTHGFALEPLGSRKVKGRLEPVDAWELLGPTTSIELTPATPLVGREREMERGERALTDLVDGRGQILLVQGDPGMGKSRLLAELRGVAAAEVTWLEGRCHSYGGDLPAWPFVEILRGWLGVREEEPSVVVRTRLRSRLDDLMGEDSGEVFPLLGRLLSLEVDPSRGQALKRVPTTEPSERIRDAYCRWIGRLAATGPVVLAIEDVHDADSETRELAESILPITDEAALLLVMTARTAIGSEGWSLWQRVRSEFHHRVSEIGLEPLSDDAAMFLTDALAPTGSLDPATKADVIARAAGNPLFLEELMRLLTESGGLDRTKGWTLTASSSVALLPPALESLLVARIQHLPPVVRGLAQVAATIGQEVPATLLEKVAGPVDVHAGMGILLRAEILQERRRYPELEYVFRHPLLREAALSTLTPARARELYGRVGSASEGSDPKPSGERLERLAFAFYRSEERAKALKYLELAARHAIELQASDQAAELLARAAKVASELGDVRAEERIGELLADVEQSGA